MLEGLSLESWPRAFTSLPLISRQLSGRGAEMIVPILQMGNTREEVAYQIPEN
jgi:hypothetical protein